MRKPKIAITMGDGAGIGPEIIIKLLSRKSIFQFCEPVIIGNSFIFEQTLKHFGIKLPINKLSNPDDFKNFSLNIIDVLDCKPKLKFGKFNNEISKIAYHSIVKAIQLAREKKIDAIVTAPVHKKNINKAGIKFIGHTELLAKLCNCKNYNMMLLSDKLCVTLVTTHIPLALVPKSISAAKIFNSIINTNNALSHLGIKNPKIAVCGLNPHAGEDEIFGNEENKIISPAIKKAVKQKINVTGPLPADTLFYCAICKKEFDAVIAMYHDQALIAIKTTSFETVVNITIGLDIIRTSPGHGTAYNIAGKGIADYSSLKKAVEIAVQLSKYACTIKTFRRIR